MCCHSLLAWRVSIERSAVILSLEFWKSLCRDQAKGSMSGQCDTSEHRGKLRSSQASTTVFLASASISGVCALPWGFSDFNSWAKDGGACARVIGWDEWGFIPLYHPAWILGSEPVFSQLLVLLRNWESCRSWFQLISLPPALCCRTWSALWIHAF